MSEPPLPVIIKFHPDSQEPELIEFYTALGMCVSSWAFIDRRLYEIFHAALQMEQRQSAFLYFRQRAFNQRLRLADDALRSFIPQDVFNKHWQMVLHKKVVKLSLTRNIFAHHPVRRLGSSIDGKPVYTYTIFIEPYERILNAEYQGLLGKQELGSADLREHDQQLEKLERDLRWFLEAIVVPQGRK